MEMKVLVEKANIEGHIGTVFERPHGIKFEQEKESAVFVREDGQAAIVEYNPEYEILYFATGHFHPDVTSCLKRVLVNDIMNYLQDAPFGTTLLNGHLLIKVVDEDTFLIEGEEVKAEHLFHELMNEVFYEDQVVEGLSGFTLTDSTIKKEMKESARQSIVSMLRDAERSRESVYIPAGEKLGFLQKEMGLFLIDTENGIVREADQEEAVNLLAVKLFEENYRLYSRIVKDTPSFTASREKIERIAPGLTHWVGSDQDPQDEISINFNRDFVYMKYEGEVEQIYIPHLCPIHLNALLKKAYGM